jgi:hypothetical protein
MNRLISIYSLEKYIRLSFVFIIIFRYGFIIYTKEDYFGSHILLKHDVVLIICLIFLIWGKFVPLALLLLNIVMVEYDALHNVSTLATTVACMASFSLIANNLLIKRKIRCKSLILKLDYSINKFILSIVNPRVLHTYSFLCYALSSLLAISLHFQDQTWLQGFTTGEILSSTYICRFHTLFAWTEINFPFFYYICSVVIGLLQTFFQVFMILSLFNKKIYLFTKYWGWIFIINSLIFLQLSSLPFVEFILWLSLFHGYSGCGKEFKINQCLTKNNKYILIFILLIFTTYIIFHFNPSRSVTISDLLKLRRPPNSFNFYKTLGLEYPDVFNTTDLKTSEHWLVLYRSELDSIIDSHDPRSSILKFYYNLTSEDLELVPFTHKSGEKGYYQLSDLLYFGNSSPYRRTLNYVNPFTNSHDNNEFLSSLVEMRILFDYRFQKLSGPYLYVGEFRIRNPNDKHSSLNIFNIIYLVENKNIVHKIPHDFEPIIYSHP